MQSRCFLAAQHSCRKGFPYNVIVTRNQHTHNIDISQHATLPRINTLDNYTYIHIKKYIHTSAVISPSPSTCLHLLVANYDERLLSDLHVTTLEQFQIQGLCMVCTWSVHGWYKVGISVSVVLLNAQKIQFQSEQLFLTAHSVMRQLRLQVEVNAQLKFKRQN